jgi:uncharacterized RDD family membrane protein YckC
MSNEQAFVVFSPEHVAIHLRSAGFGRRFAAFLIDSLLILGLINVVGLVVQIFPAALSTIIIITSTFIITWGYHVLSETRYAGQSLGKRLLSLRVVDARGLPISVRQSLVRNVVRALDMVPAGGIGMACCIIDRHRRRLGDLVAGTLVVEERQPPTVDIQAVQARRQNSLDTPRMRRLIANRISLEEREFLLALVLRASAIDELPRYELFERVGAHYREKLGIEVQQLSGENLVRGLVALFYAQRRAGG